MTSNSANDKNILRKKMRQQRMQLSEAEIDHAAASINYQLWNVPALKRANRIAAYIGVNGEADCSEIFRSAWLRKKSTYVPILRKNRMLFAKLTSKTKLQNNHFGIPEPKVTTAEVVWPKNLDIILMPLVAFDSNGHRLGMGGGFYDRTLQQLRLREKYRRPLLIGMAYDFQLTGHIHKEDWDIPLHAVITETGFQHFI